MRVQVHPCSFGYALVATKNSMLYGLELGKTVDDCYRTFINRWEKRGYDKTIEPGETDHSLTQEVLAAVEEKPYNQNLPMFMDGTWLQHEVWLHLMKKVGSGTVATYKDVAMAINRPHSARAVANAIAANPIAIIIPCHRVVRSDGKLGGFRWGSEIKRSLLRREGINYTS